MTQPESFLAPSKIKLSLTVLLMSFLPILHLRYVTSPIVACDGATCPEAFAVVEMYSPVGLFVEGLFGITKFRKLAMLPSTVPSMVLAFLGAYIVISFFLQHRQARHHGDTV